MTHPQSPPDGAEFEAWALREYGHLVPEHVTDKLGWLDLTKARAAWQAARSRPASPAAGPNSDEVICPNCVHQFRAIPVNVQKMLRSAGYEPPYLAPAAPAPAAEQDTQAAEQPGFVLVPVEPTKEMLEAWLRAEADEPVGLVPASGNYWQAQATNSYRAMLAARPQPSPPQAEKE